VRGGGGGGRIVWWGEAVRLDAGVGWRGIKIVR